MPSKRNKELKELSQLIREQEKDAQSLHFFPERINPRRQVLFPALTPRMRACFILSFFMRRREIALVLNVKPETVSTYRKRGLNLLPKHDIEKYRRIRFGGSSVMSSLNNSAGV